VKSHSRALAAFQSNGTTGKEEAISMKYVFCSYVDEIVYLLYNSQSL